MKKQVFPIFPHKPFFRQGFSANKTIYVIEKTYCKFKSHNTRMYIMLYMNTAGVF